MLGDPVRLEQVVSNLLSNAAKYTDPGGEISVSVARVGDEATITVRDNGIGIAVDKLPQLFEIFFQVRESLDRAQGGLGIGLSITKQLVALHGGRVEGFSEGLGKGSEFSVHLPTSLEIDDHPAPRQSRAHSEPSSSIAHRVLIVDDNTDMADVVAEYAQLWGHTVKVAYDGPTALEIASTFRPEIALVDIGLPQMNGYELARRLRRLGGAEATLLVALTGYARDADREEARKAGFNYHPVKPIEPARLMHLLATMEDVDRMT